MDDEPADADLTIEALNASGFVVAAVRTQTANTMELITDKGTRDITLSRALFTATIPDDGSIKSIRILKGEEIIFTKLVDDITLEIVIQELNTNAFKVKTPLSRVGLRYIEHQYSLYQKFKATHSKIAKFHLLQVKFAVLLLLKEELVLSNGVLISKSEIVELIDQELDLPK